LSRGCGGGGVSARRPVVSRLGWQRLLPWWGHRGGGRGWCYSGGDVTGDGDEASGGGGDVV
nr:hypothetical protein [Tanacetum cinerariifolium]